MVVLGLILILLGVLIGGYIVMGGLPSQGGSDVSLSFLGLNVQTSAVVIFALGALTLLLIELGVLAMRSGARKAARRRAELQRLRRVESEVQTRQSADVQRNASAAPPVSPPAPFARRDTGDSDTGRTEAVRDNRPDSSARDSVRMDKTGAGPTPAQDVPHRDVSDVRPPETGPAGGGSSGSDPSDSGAGSRSVGSDPSDGTTRADRP